MRMKRWITLLVLLVSFTACKSASNGERAASLMREGNGLLAQGTKATDEWSREYMKSFNPTTRAQFPANRDQLRASADKIVKALDEATRLNNSAIEKFEQAMNLMSDGPQRKGLALLISASKKDEQVNELFKSQMRLVNDEKIVDANTFNERFLKILEPVAAIRRQHQAEFEEGKRLLTP